jgi:AcrR family transcriptional regulator
MGRLPDPGRRDEVLSKAIEYLVEHGLSNLSLRKLAGAMGTSTNTISYQFGSKEKLIEAALERAQQTTLAQLANLRAVPERTIADTILHLWDWWMENPRNLLSTRLRMEAMMASDQDVALDRRPELLSFWIAYFTEWIEDERHCETAQALTESTLLMAVLSGLVVDVQSTGDTERARRALVSYLSPWGLTA